MNAFRKIFSKIIGFLFEPSDPEERQETYDPETDEEGKPERDENGTRSTIVLSAPVSLEEARTLCDHLKAGQSVLFSIGKIQPETDRQRVLDFMSGVILAKNGKIRRISDEAVICVPRNVELLEGNAAHRE